MKKIILLVIALSMVISGLSAVTYVAAADKLPVSDVKIAGVGVFDSGVKGIHTFNPDAKLIQVKFTGIFYNPAELSNNEKLWIQSEIGDFVKVNGKTVTEWNNIEFNSVQIHVRNTSVLGQYLEFNFSGLEGLPTEAIDNEFVFSEDFPMYEGKRLGEEVTYAYKANNNVPFVLNGDFPEETDPAVENPAKVKGIGVFDTNPAKGIHTFDENAKLFQITFTDIFYSPSKLTDNQRLFVQGELGDYIKINGKTVTEWNNLQFNSVMIHVKNSTSIGQYLEINVSGYAGLPTESIDNEIILLADFPLYGGTTLGEDVMYAYKANNNIPFALNGIFEEATTVEETVKQEITEEETTNPFVIVDDVTTAQETQITASATTTVAKNETETAADETSEAVGGKGCGGTVASAFAIAVIGVAYVAVKKRK